MVQKALTMSEEEKQNNKHRAKGKIGWTPLRKEEKENKDLKKCVLVLRAIHLAVSSLVN